jgi:hypothetical protein
MHYACAIFASRPPGLIAQCYNPPMTLMTVTYELQKQLNPAQFRALGEFSNTYGLHKFRYDETSNRLMFDYDASRLRETVVEHVLRQSRIPVLRRVENS